MTYRKGFPGSSDDIRICLQCRRLGFDPWFGEILWRREWQPIPIFLPGGFCGQKSLVGYIVHEAQGVRHD